ncbi:MAG: NAD(P)-dependent oxidoreductase [Bacteroidota bacterium]
MKILITGITGFLGFKLSEKLKKTNEIYGLLGPSGKTILSPEVELYEYDKIDTIIGQPDVVVMCHAAIESGNEKINGDKLYFSNVKFTKQVAELFPNSFILYISSTSVYGKNMDVITEFTSVNPESQYAISKLWGEKIVNAYENYAILRLSSLYGKGMKENTIIPQYVQQAILNNQINVWGSGNRLQNYLNVNEAISYIERIIHHRSNGVHLGVSRNELSNIELAQLIKSITNSDIIFTGQDESASTRFNNIITKQKLEEIKEINLFDGINEYIKWKKEQS